MNLQELHFDRPRELQATRPAESRGMARDDVRLLVSTPTQQSHSRFSRLADFLTPGDLLVVNRSATIPASLPAVAAWGTFTLNLSTNYGGGLWLAEPRVSATQPGPIGIRPGETIAVGEQKARMVAPFPGQPRLWFVQTDEHFCRMLWKLGKPIRYGYVQGDYPLDAYQTIFSRVPGSAEMPSAARPFTAGVLADLRRRGVGIAGVLLHTGVSSLEVETPEVEQHVLYAEPFKVPRVTADAVNRAHAVGRRVIAVGTTVVRALESTWRNGAVHPAKGFTRLYIHPGQGVKVVDGLVTGFHDPYASHLAMLYAIGGQEMIRAAYAEATKAGYLWHEFGDSHLILGAGRRGTAEAAP